MMGAVHNLVDKCLDWWVPYAVNTVDVRHSNFVVLHAMKDYILYYAAAVTTARHAAAR